MRTTESCPDVLDLRETDRPGGVIVGPPGEQTVDAQGVAARRRIALPAWEAACYWAAYQKHDPINPATDWWPEGTNRIQPLAVSSCAGLKRGGTFMLLRLAGGAGCLALLPIAGPCTLAWLEAGDDAAPTLAWGNLGTGPVAGGAPLLAWARAEDAYAACRAAWSAALAHPGIGYTAQRRERKQYPEVFRYLGWCSWEEYKHEIDEARLLDAAAKIEASPLPIRFMLVDDGHNDERDRQLLSFGVNAKFPRGWAPLLARRSPKLRWFGLWLNMQGFWDGVHPEHRLEALREHLCFRDNIDIWRAGRIKRMGLPAGPGLAATAFYDAFIGAAREQGFDFVKVDNQAGNLSRYVGAPQAVASSAANHQALEAAAARHMDGLVNCMAHNALCTFNTRLSAVTRCSEDYVVGSLPRARRHLHNSYANMPWLGQTVWGDHDMFHSDDATSGEIMAVSKALSGGPVYLSDAPDRFVAERVWPLCYADGELLRPAAPATPLAEDLWVDPIGTAAALRVVAPLAGGAVAFAIYNLTEPEQPVATELRPEHVTEAAALLDESGRREASDWVLHDWFGGKAWRWRGPEAVRLPGFGHRLLLACPLRAGWAVLGRADKFLGPVAAEVLRAEANRLLLRLAESGPLLVWREGEAPRCDGGAAESVGPGLWRFNLPVGERGAVVELTVGGT